MPLTKSQAYERVRQLRTDLERIVDGDAEQDVLGMAATVVDAAFEAARRFLDPDDPLAQRSTDVVIETIESGEPLRAVDAFVVAGQLQRALYEPPRMVTETGPSIMGDIARRQF